MSGLHSTCIANLKSNPTIGARIRAMENTNDMVFDIAEIPVSASMIQMGGGQTYEEGPYAAWPEPPVDCDGFERKIVVNISTFSAQQVFSVSPWPMSGVFVDDQDVLLAHELGHAEYIWKNGASKSTGEASMPNSLMFENAMRASYGFPTRYSHY